MPRTYRHIPMYGYGGMQKASGAGRFLGPELVTINADFSIADATANGRAGEWQWLTGSNGWNIASGTANNATNFNPLTYEALNAVEGKRYRVVYTLVSGNLISAGFGGQSLNKVSGVTNTTDITASDDAVLTLAASSDAPVIDDVSIREIL